VKILDFGQIQDKARVWFAQQVRRNQGIEEGPTEPYTVARCMADYLGWFRLHKKGYETTRWVIEAHILPSLGKRDVSALTATTIKKWLQELAETPARLRSPRGTPLKFRPIEGPEGERKRKATANRILTVLKAALNMAYEDGRVSSDSAWRRVKGFKGVDSPRVAYLEVDEAAKLLDACEPHFRALVKGALVSGCRYGELVALQVGDVTDQGAIHIRQSKSSKPRYVYLNEDGARFFTQLVAGRSEGERLFLKDDGKPWGRSEQTRRIKAACQTAGLSSDVSFHILRHTYASHYLMTRGSLAALAQQLGHSDTRMTTRHYAHLAESWRAEEARRTGLRFDLAS
jgi:integrase